MYDQDDKQANFSSFELVNQLAQKQEIFKILVQVSVVTGTNFSVGFRLLGHNQNPNRPKFIKLELSVVINTSFRAISLSFCCLFLLKQHNAHFSR